MGHFLEKMNDKVKCECCECNKEINYKDSYRCRICKDYFCDKCSLETLWTIRKRRSN